MEKKYTVTLELTTSFMLDLALILDGKAKQFSEATYTGYGFKVRAQENAQTLRQIAQTLRSRANEIEAK